MILSVKNISKEFGTQKALDNVNFELSKGEFFSLLGPSGCGKTTLLRIIAGLEFPTSGIIELNGKDSSGLPPQKRNVGVVFQNYALFPNMTVFQNVAYGLEVRKFSPVKIRERVSEVLEKVRISHKTNSNVTTLSGGEQQRVSLARVIVTEPDLLLFDEPLSNLDYALRLETRNEIKRLQRDIGITSVYVTHDQSEALALSDRIAVMNSGKVIQVGTPEEVYLKPADKFIAEFIGHSNFFNTEEAEKYFSIRIGNDETLSVFPEEIELSSGNGMDECRVTDAQFAGAFAEYVIDCEGREVKVLAYFRNGGKLNSIGDKVCMKLVNYEKRLLRK
ncbi:MAG: ABC transporter ATP-binding protein [Ignavibacteria bacterium]|nr:ABC transporter ATP-binding protein [Ignavibacteria bacterium]